MYKRQKLTHRYIITVIAYNINGYTSSLPFDIYYDIPLPPTGLLLTPNNLLWDKSLYSIDAPNNFIITYDVTIKDTFNNITTTTNTTTTTNSIPITPILDHNYEFFVSASNLIGTSSFTNLIKLWCLLNAPSGLIMNSPTSFSWSPGPLITNSPSLINYTLNISSIIAGVITNVQTINSITPFVTIPLLKYDIAYNFSVTSNNDAGRSLSCDLNNILYSVPNPVTNLHVIPNLISWTLPLPTNIPITSVEITIVDNNGPIQILSLPGNAISTIFNMNNNTTYNISVILVNMFGQSIPTNYSFTTNIVSTPCNLTFNSNNITWTKSTPISNIYQDSGYILTISRLGRADKIFNLPSTALSYTYNNIAHGFMPKLNNSYSATIVAIGLTGNSLISLPTKINWGLPNSVNNISYLNNLLSWVNPLQNIDDPAIKSYILTLNTTPFGSQTTTKNIYNISGPTTSYNLLFTKNNNYKISLVTRNIVGNSLPERFNFNAAVPSPPLSLKYDRINHILSFDNSNNNNNVSPIISYTLEIYDDRYNNITLKTALANPVPIHPLIALDLGLSTTYTFQNFTPNHRYTCVAIANNLYGSSVRSNTYNFIG